MKHVDASFKAAEEIRAGCLCFRVRRASRALTRAYDEALRPLGIQAPQLTLLSAIAAAGPMGQRVPVLVDLLAMDATTLSRNLRQLEKPGLVSLHRAPADRRVRVVRLTDAGRGTLDAALPLWRSAHARLAQKLGEENAQALGKALDEAVARTSA